MEREDSQEAGLGTIERSALSRGAARKAARFELKVEQRFFLSAAEGESLEKPRGSLYNVDICGAAYRRAAA